jgi:MoaA/NifB/PqqE/SkfB family radical SAM enzyme
VFIQKENRKKLFDSGMDNLRVSVEEVVQGQNNAHPYSKKLLDSLEELAKERADARSRLRLFFNTVVHLGNCDQIPLIIKHAEKIGFDCVELIHLDKKSNDIYEYLPAKKEIALYKKIKKMSFRIKVTSLYD